MALLDRFRRGVASRRPRAARPALPAPGALRRERRRLIQLREERLRDLGGLILEMYRRDRFREDLLAERCNELLGIDARLHELDAMLAAARHRVPVERCACGAPLPFGSHFCPNCGRSIGEAVLACRGCGHALPAGARFCAACGAPEEGVPSAEESKQEPEAAGSGTSESGASVPLPAAGKPDDEAENSLELEPEPKEA